jgi:1-deoxy-D-xylulose-5-phosphate synthase
MVVCAPRDGQELRNLIYTGLQWSDGPFGIRYPRDKAPDHIDWDETPALLKVGSWETLREGRRVAVLATGTMVEAARKVIAAEEYNVTLVNARFIKPLDEVLLSQLLDTHEAVLTLEEGAAAGGLGSQVSMYLKSNGHEQLFHALHLPDSFIEHGTRSQLMEIAGLSPRHISEAIDGLLKAELPASLAARSNKREIAS